MLNLSWKDYNRLIKDTVEDEKLKKLLELSERSTWRLNCLVGAILDYARLEKGSIELKTEVIDISEQINETLSNINGLALDKGIEIKAEKASAFPEVFGDPEAIQIIIGNLLDNSIKFSERGALSL